MMTFKVYCAHLDELQIDMSERFQDPLLLKIADWVINPFLDVSGEETEEADKELISIQNMELSVKAITFENIFCVLCYFFSM